MGDVVLRWKLPHPRLREFSFLIDMKMTWGVLVLTTRKSTCPPNCGFQFGRSLEQDRNIMRVQPWMTEEGTWKRNAILRSKILPGNCQMWLETLWGGVTEGVLTLSDQSGITWVLCHSGLTTSGTWRVLRQFLPGLFLK
jgi:hypothetical protein